MILIPIGSTIQKRAGASKIYGIDWTDFVAPNTITGVTFSISGPDGALTFDSATFNTVSTSCRLIGGTAGKTYRVDATVTISGSPTQTEVRSFFVEVT